MIHEAFDDRAELRAAHLHAASVYLLQDDLGEPGKSMCQLATGSTRHSSNAINASICQLLLLLLPFVDLSPSSSPTFCSNYWPTIRIVFN